MEDQQQLCDPAAWPSRYYGRTRHIDIEQLYKQLTTTERPRRSVSFSTAAPTVYEYEPEFDDDDIPPPYEELAFVPFRDLECSTTVYHSKRKQKSQGLRKLDLRPVVNMEYKPASDDDDDKSVASSECSLPTTPPDIFPSITLPQSKKVDIVRSSLSRLPWFQQRRK
ncbi:hypothetical protein BJV82DRAFT_594470 [Fennellomyces sp. T-0311]|nr:hypothetical protein BJV82DRAFT_594470 [Fennellomyces sp. T-0311]